MRVLLVPADVGVVVGVAGRFWGVLVLLSFGLGVGVRLTRWAGMPTELSNGLVTIFNGVYNAVGHLVDPFVLAAVACGVSLAWIARLDMAELDRQGAKPVVKRH